MTNKGFTLIEVVVAMSIFSMIALGTSTGVTRGLTVKKKVEKEWDEVHGIRTALFRLERDISLAFHIKKPAATGFASLDTQNKWFKTFFIGKPEQLHFTSLSHRKLYSNLHESEMAEVGYRLIAHEEDMSKYRLVRREDPIIDEDSEKGGEEFPLLENIHKLTFRFFSKKQDRWFDEWDTSRRDFEDQFPEAVEVKFSFKMTTGHPLGRGEPSNEKEQEYIAKILISNPNNETPPGGPPPSP